MTKNDMRELVETVLSRLSTDESPQTACKKWDYCADDPCCYDGGSCDIWDFCVDWCPDACADDPCACTDGAVEW